MAHLLPVLPASSTSFTARSRMSPLRSSTSSAPTRSRCDPVGSSQAPPPLFCQAHFFWQAAARRPYAAASLPRALFLSAAARGRVAAAAFAYYCPRASAVALTLFTPSSGQRRSSCCSLSMTPARAVRVGVRCALSSGSAHSSHDDPTEYKTLHPYERKSRLTRVAFSEGDLDTVAAQTQRAVRTLRTTPSLCQRLTAPALSIQRESDTIFSQRCAAVPSPASNRSRPAPQRRPGRLAYLSRGHGVLQALHRGRG